MKKRFVNLALAAIGCVSLLGLTACGETEKDNSGWNNEYTINRAYALAVEKGYGGTLEEFIESISGKDGTNGMDGKSAYEIWLANGNKGTQADFIESISGKDGTNGTDGKSAYEIWLANGHEGTESDFLEWLKATAPVCEHAYSEWGFVIQPSCTAGGVEERSCESCGNIEYRFTQAKGHNAEIPADYYDVNDAVYHIAVCSECNTLSRERHQFENHICVQCGAMTSELELEYVPPITNPHYSLPYNEIYINETVGWTYRHKALDFAAEVGTEVYAMADGIVETVGYNSTSGNYITIDHGNGLKTRCCYVEPVTEIAVGATVKSGQVIATVAEVYGSEAHDGPHLHFEVSVNGKAVNPLDYFDATYDGNIEE